MEHCISARYTKLKRIIRSNNGFTLIEMMAVMAILAILATFLVPRFQNIKAIANTVKVKSDIQSIQTALTSYELEHGTMTTSMDQLTQYLGNQKPSSPIGSIYINGELTDLKGISKSGYAIDDKGKVTFAGHELNDFSVTKSEDHT